MVCGSSTSRGHNPLTGGMGRKGGRRMAARLVLAGLIAFAALVSGRIPASAHSNFVGSDPARGSPVGPAPAAGGRDFDAKVSAALTNVGLADAEGRTHSITSVSVDPGRDTRLVVALPALTRDTYRVSRSEEHTSELQSRGHLVC